MTTPNWVSKTRRYAARYFNPHWLRNADDFDKIRQNEAARQTLKPPPGKTEGRKNA